jgi:ABC-type transporter Mla subunit MlaD
MKRERKWGWGVIAALVLAGALAAGLYLAQEAAALKYTILFKEAKNLKVGDRVQMSGVDIGAVQYLELHTAPPRVDVRVRIDPKHARQVRSDSTAIIKSSTGMVNVSGQMVVEIVNPSTDAPAEPMRPDATIEGMNGVIDLKTWELKNKFSGSGETWSRRLEVARDSLSNRMEEVKELTASPQVREVFAKLRDFLDEMRKKGADAADQLAERWPQLKEEIAPALKELAEQGREYIAQQIRQIMDQIEETLNEWRRRIPGDPGAAPPVPEAPAEPAGNAA